MIESAGIIAAGEGLRLKEAGVRIHKPLVPIAGFPLIGHRLRQFVESGIQSAVIIFNEGQQECADWVRKHFPAIDLHILIKSTKSSFESFWRVGRALGPGRHLISTVDVICSSDDWHKMLNSKAPLLREILLGVTSFVHDEKPLWVRTAPGSFKIVEIGGGADDYATAGLYAVDESVFERTLREDISSLRVFLRELLREGFPVRAVPLADVIDVDTVADIQLAEQFLARHGRSF